MKNCVISRVPNGQVPTLLCPTATRRNLGLGAASPRPGSRLNAVFVFDPGGGIKDSSAALRD